jgi:hypothetical protein
VQHKKPNNLIGNWIVNSEEYNIASTLSEKKIGDFNREEMGSIVDLMANWRLMLGVTNEVTQEELVFITQFIYDNYKYLCLRDLEYAKNWAIMGKTDVGFVTQKTFSSYYVSRCINAYEVEKRRIINEISHRKERYETKKAIEKPTQLSPQEKANSFKDHLLTLYKSFNEEREYVDIGDMVYNWAKENNLLSLNPREVDAAMVYAKERLREYKTTEKSVSTSLNVPMDEDTRLKKYARIFVLNNMFRKYAISELLSKINLDYFKKQPL